MKLPLLLNYPSEILRLLITGYVFSPDGNIWDIAFTPGIKGTGNKSLECLKFGKLSFRFFNKYGWLLFKDFFIGGFYKTILYALNMHHYRLIISDGYNLLRKQINYGIDTIKRIPQNISINITTINELYSNSSFGWLYFVIKIIVWDCCIINVALFILSIIYIIVVAPAGFILWIILFSSLKLIVNISLSIFCVFSAFISLGFGIIMSIISMIFCIIISFIVLVMGITISISVVMFSVTNRFPNPEQNGKCGLHIVKTRVS